MSNICIYNVEMWACISWLYPNTIVPITHQPAAKHHITNGYRYLIPHQHLLSYLFDFNIRYWCNVSCLSRLLDKRPISCRLPIFFHNIHIEQTWIGQHFTHDTSMISMIFFHSAFYLIYGNNSRAEMSICMCKHWKSLSDQLAPCWLQG